jgi:two-component system, cell cycle sensor histidine kinase and response regulator CckA
LKTLDIIRFRVLTLEVSMVEVEIFSDNVLTKEWIKDRFAIEGAVAEISRIFFYPDNADLNRILSIIGKAVSVDRTYILRFNEENGKIEFVHEWFDTIGTLSMKDLDNDLERIFYPWLIAGLQRYDNVMISDVGVLPPEFEKEKKILKSREVCSLLAIPIFSSSGSLVGSIGFENTRECREWLGEEVQALRVISEMVSIYWERSAVFNALKKSEEKYRELYEEVKKTEAVYRSLIASSADSIVMSDRDGQVIYINSSFINLFGWTLDDMNQKDMPFIPASEKYIYEMVLKDIIREGTSCNNLETRRRTKDGRLIDVSLSISRYDNHEGLPAGMLYVFRDISERKQLEAQLIQAQKMEAIGTLAGGIAHDFNNNLQGIFACIEMLLMGKEKGHPDYTKLKTIEKSAERAGNLTKHLLVFGRKMDNKFEPVDLNNEVRHVSTILERTIPKMIGIELDLDRNIKMINADPGQLEQIMLNLGVNARDAMPDGGKLSFKTEEVVLDNKYCAANPSFNPGCYVLLSISDNGSGMEKEVLDHIFEPFFTTKKKGKGTGLGLSMVYGIVKNHKAHVTCRSAPDQGTTFSIYFPLPETICEPDFKNESEELIRGNGEIILLVDDEETNRELGKEILEESGFIAITASDGETALECYKENKDRVDLVILDLIMPGMGGASCLKKIAGFDPGAKVIIATGLASDKSSIDELKQYARDFITKPYNMKTMLGVIKKVLS